MDYRKIYKSYSEKVSSDDEALKLLFDIRYDSDECLNPRCRAPRKFINPLKSRKAFMCDICLTHYFPMVGSIMEGSHLSPMKWINYMLDFTHFPSTTSRTAFNYETTPNTAKRMGELVRQLMKQELDKHEFTGLPVEIDETGVKTGTKGLGRHYPFLKGRGSEHTTSVLAIVQRGGELCKMYKIQSQGAEGIFPIIEKELPENTPIYTDSFATYTKLKYTKHEHLTVNHKKKEYVNGPASTNLNENVFSVMKRQIAGNYLSTSDHKLELYLAEFAFRYTHRLEPDRGFGALLRTLQPLSNCYKFEPMEKAGNQ